MKRERRNGDATMNRNQYKQNVGDANAIVKIFIDGDDYTGSIWRFNEYSDPKRPADRQPNPNDPTYLGDLDYNGRKCRIALWLNFKGKDVENLNAGKGPRPNVTGRVNFAGYSRSISMWERVNSNTNEIFWSGSLDMRDEYKKVYNPPQGHQGGSSTRGDSYSQSQSQGGGQNQKAAENKAFDIEKDLPF